MEQIFHLFFESLTVEESQSASFQQYSAAAHTARASVVALRELFENSSNIIVVCGLHTA
jgi:hypothetical protein